MAARPSRFESDLAALRKGHGTHLGRLTAVLADHYGDRPAVEDDSPTPGLHPGGLRTHRDVEHAVARLAAAHRAAGIGADDRVMIVLDNRLDVVLHAMAVGRLGGIAVPVNGRLRPAELEAVRVAAGAAWIVADDDIADRLADAGVGVDSTWQRTGLVADTPGTIAHWCQSSDDAVEAPDGLDAGDVALYLTTSGTTGVPKAAALTSRGLLETPGRLTLLPVGQQQGRRAGRDVVLSALPMAHVMGFGNVLGMLCAGVRLIHRTRFDAAEMLDLIEQRRPNVFIGVPTMYADLEAAGAAERDLSSLQLFASSADAMPPERARRFRQYGSAVRLRNHRVGAATFVDGYGMVELSGAGAVRLYPPGPSWLPSTSVAAVVPGLEVRAVDEDGNRVRFGQIGELQFRGPGVLSHYEGHEAAGPDADGWLSTGDFARIWPGGFFSFSGRRRDRLKVGGFSVFPAEVEHELATHPGVSEVAVVGVPDGRLGERPVALVVPRDGAFDPAEFLSWAQVNVAGYRCPQSVHVVEGIPRGANAKVDRATATTTGVELEAAASGAPTA